jgi:hypothetical protein
MIKVRILRGLRSPLLRVSAAALAIPGALTACSETDQELSSADESNNTESLAGSGVLTLHGWRLNYGSTSGGDEFIRIGEKLKVAIDHVSTVNMVAGDSATRQDLLSDANKLKVELRVQYTKADGTTYDADSIPVTWGPGASNLTVGNSGELTVPKQIRRLKVELVASFMKAGIPTTVQILDAARINREFVVFGAYTPNKLALFDTNGSERRTRVVEGGAVIKGADVLVSVTDWRLDTVVDKSTLDLRVGDKQSGSRFGPVIVPAYGDLEYEVSAVVSSDGGATYEPLNLTKADRPDVLAASVEYRFAYQAAAAIKANGGPSMKVAFHVRAFLKVPNGGFINQRYAPGSRILLKDVWDNNGGADYALPIASR